MEIPPSEIETDRKIEPTELDVACAAQPDLIGKWGDRMVEAVNAEDLAEFAMKQTESRLSLDIRDDPAHFGFTDKVTEGAIAAKISVHPDYTKARFLYIESRRNAQAMKQAVSAMQSREKMLGLLIDLFGKQYFAGPAIPRDLERAFRDYRENKNKVLDEKQRNKVRRVTKGA